MPHPTTPAPTMVGSSAVLRAADSLATRFARSPLATVLLVGETGTGKELFARSIHARGPGASGPFIPVNCAAIPGHLLESELFGHEAGAFTDAKGVKQGLFEVAAGGTLFLDEIGELDVALQAKLLRVLEDRAVRRVGGVRELPLHCRVIAATNVLLEHAVLSGGFRADLYYRLNVFRIDLPPLRERPDDIPALAHAFLEEAVREHRLPARTLGDEAIAVLARHRWPGNVRELRNVIHRAAVTSDEAQVGARDLVLQQRVTATAGSVAIEDGRVIRIPEGGRPLADIEREALLITLDLARGNRSAAARMLGLSRATLLRRLREYALPEGEPAVGVDQWGIPTPLSVRSVGEPS